MLYQISHWLRIVDMFAAHAPLILYLHHQKLSRRISHKLVSTRLCFQFYFIMDSTLQSFNFKQNALLPKLLGTLNVCIRGF